MTRLASPEDAKRLLSLLARPGEVFELRGLVRINGQQHVTSGFFDDVDALVRAAVERSGKDDGIYLTVNPVNPALLARAPKNKVRRAGSGDTTSDRDVAQRRSILVDIDPVRPTGISSTNAEHEAALDLARQIRDELSVAGWPLPIFADSGNGGHLIYAVDLPVDDGGLVKRVLERLSKTYTTPALKVDEKVFNPARISKIYGTLTRKGENTPERPHRIARIIDAPAELTCIPTSTLEAFSPLQTKSGRDLRTKTDRPSQGRVEFDLVTWLAQHVPGAKEHSWSSGRKWILKVCPFDDSHDRSEAYVTQKHDGTIAAGCQHDTCFSSWKELRTKFEPEAYERRSNGNGTGRKFTGREPPPEVLFEDERYADDIARTEHEYETFAARDEEARADTAIPKTYPWRRGPELVDPLVERAADQWVRLVLGPDELARVCVGATVVLIGGSGSGKSSLATCLLVEHARNVGPAIALSIELPAEELAARIVGQRCDASWEDVLRGRVKREFMAQALALPRLYVLDRKRATLKNLAAAVGQAHLDYPDQPIMVGIDYAQLLDSKEREARLRVAEIFAQIDDLAREKHFVAIALSQMSRASAQRARKGEAIGAESADLGAESAAIERYATLTLSIGQAIEREDCSSAVELSVGKARMSKGDRVIPMTYEGITGKWRVAGDAKTATEVRDQRDAGKQDSKQAEIRNLLVGVAHRSTAPLSREQLQEQISKGSKKERLAAIAGLLASGELVEVAQRALRSRSWTIWTPDRVNATPGLRLVRDMPDGEGG